MTHRGEGRRGFSPPDGDGSPHAPRIVSGRRTTRGNAHAEWEEERGETFAQLAQELEEWDAASKVRFSGVEFFDVIGD